MLTVGDDCPMLFVLEFCCFALGFEVGIGLRDILLCPCESVGPLPLALLLTLKMAPLPAAIDFRFCKAGLSLCLAILTRFVLSLVLCFLIVVECSCFPYFSPLWDVLSEPETSSFFSCLIFSDLLEKRWSWAEQQSNKPIWRAKN